MNAKNYEKAEIGRLSDLKDHIHLLPDSGLEMRGKLFINELVGLTGSEISFNAMAPGESMPFYHTHTHNEEVYIILSGLGEFQVDGALIPVSEGSVIRMAPGAVRTWRNVSNDSELRFITIQAREHSMDNSRPTSDGIALDEAVRWRK